MNKQRLPQILPPVSWLFSELLAKPLPRHVPSLIATQLITLSCDAWHCRHLLAELGDRLLLQPD